MAYNLNAKKTGAIILRTPAPDAISNIRHPGVAGPGMNGPQPSSIPAGAASRSVLGQNLMESSDDGQGVLQKVIESGVAGRDDRIPADGSLQQRAVSNTPLPTTFGMKGATPGPKIPGAK